MRARLTLALSLLTTAPLTAQGSLFHETFSGGTIPNGWTIDQNGGSYRFDGNGDAAMLVMQGKDISFRSPPKSKSGLLTFAYRPAQLGDDYTIHVEQRVGSGDWKPFMTLEQSGATTSSTGMVTREHPLLSLPATEIRWRMVRYNTGQFRLDGIDLTEMNVDEIRSAETSALRASIVDSLSKVVDHAWERKSFQQVEAAFKEAGSALRTDLRLQRNLVREARDIALLANLASAVKDRNLMGNPTHYQGFKTLSTELQGTLPPVKKSRLMDIVGGLGTAVNLVSSASNLLSGDIKGAIEGFKDLMADGNTKASLEEGLPGFGNRGRRDDLIASAPNRYASARAFLDVVIKESDRVGALNTQLDEVRDAARQVERGALEHLRETFVMIGAASDSGSVESWLRGDDVAVATVDSVLAKHLVDKLGTRASYRGDHVSTEHQRTLRAVQEKITTSEQMRLGTVALQRQTLQYMDAFLNDLAAGNPFTRAISDPANANINMALLQTAEATWRTTGNTAERSMKESRAAFDRDHVRRNLYQ